MITLHVVETGADRRVIFSRGSRPTAARPGEGRPHKTVAEAYMRP